MNIKHLGSKLAKTTGQWNAQKWDTQTNWKDKGAWISIKWKEGCPENEWQKLQNGQNVIKHIWSTTGEWDCKLWISSNSHKEVENFVHNVIHTNPWVQSTEEEWSYQWK